VHDALHSMEKTVQLAAPVVVVVNRKGALMLDERSMGSVDVDPKAAERRGPPIS
jgi:hypothetical protein